MTSTTQTRTVILSATDGTEVSDDVLRTSALLASSVPQGELHLLFVVEPLPQRNGLSAFLPSLDALVTEGRTVLEKASVRAREFFGGRVETHLGFGDASREILQLSANLSADLIVVGSHGRRGIERVLLGSVSEQVVRKASCQVLVARPKDYGNKAVPEIEPPCEECLATQSETGGEKLWCAAHAHRREHAHGRLHYEAPPSFGVGSMLLRPEQ